MSRKWCQTKAKLLWPPLDIYEDTGTFTGENVRSGSYWGLFYEEDKQAKRDIDFYKNNWA